jgi:hypothetical protein
MVDGALCRGREEGRPGIARGDGSARLANGCFSRRAAKRRLTLVPELPRPVYGVVSDFLEEAVELFPPREEAQAVVQAWDRDAPSMRGN